MTSKIQLLMVDNYDSFTYNIVQYLAELGAQVHVVRNGYFGSAEKFQLYNGSQLKKRIEEAGGLTLDFPDLADRVADQMATQRLTIQGALSEMPLGHRAELIRWRDEAFKVLGQVMT